MTRLLSWVAANLLLLLASNAAAAQAVLTAVTANLPPFTIENAPLERGFSYDLVIEMGKRAGFRIEVEFMPWKRAQVVALETPGILIFTLSRSASREANYHWIVRLLETKVGFVSTKGAIDSFAQAKPLLITVVPGGPQSRELDQAGVKRVELIEDPNAAAKMLESGRVDGWYTHDLRAAYVWKKNGFATGSLSFGKPIRAQQMYLAANKDISPAVVDKLRAAYDSMLKDGSYAMLFRKYFGELKRPD